MTPDPRPQNKTLVIGVYDNATDDLLKLDLSWLNIRIYRLTDPALKAYIESISLMDEFHDWFQETFKVFEEILNDANRMHDLLYAFVPIDIYEPVSADTYHLIEKIILIMFPTDFYLHSLLDYDPTHKRSGYPGVFRSFFEEHSQWTIKENDALPDDLILCMDANKVDEINDFIKLSWNRIPKLEYLQLGIRTYRNSFNQKFVDMKYLSLCITLESLIDSRSEITHRISRTCAVVNSDNEIQGKNIYFNTRQFYDLRSAIVHGDTYRKEREYFFKLQALVSRTLIELIALNIPDRNSLNDFVTKSGFGDKNKWDISYEKPNFNEAVSNAIIHRVSPYSKKST